MEIENQSGEAIVVLNARPVTHATWEENLIEGQFIADGRSIGADLDNGTTDCVYDLRVGLADGTTREHRQVNICRISRWLISASAEFGAIVRGAHEGDSQG